MDVAPVSEGTSSVRRDLPGLPRGLRLAGKRGRGGEQQALQREARDYQRRWENEKARTNF